MIMYPIFYRNHGIRLAGQLKTVNLISDVEELPIGSMVHILDGFDGRKDTPPTPDTSNVWWKVGPGKKFLAYQSVLNNPDDNPYVKKDKMMRLPTTVVAKAIALFRQQNANYVKFVASPRALISRAGYQATIVHNRLFAYRMTGILQYHRKFVQIMSSVLNSVADSPDFYHFIPFPLSDRVFSRGAFDRAITKITTSTVKYPNSYHYLFMLHFLGLLSPLEETTSIFRMIPKELVDRIIFVPYNGDKCVFYNLGTMLKFREDIPTLYLQVLNQFNRIATSTIDVENESEVEALEATQLDKPKQANNVEQPKEPEKTVEVKQLVDDKPEVEEAPIVRRGAHFQPRQVVKPNEQVTPEEVEETTPDVVDNKPVKTPTTARPSSIPAVPVVTQEKPESTEPAVVKPLPTGAKLSKVDMDPGLPKNIASFSGSASPDTIKQMLSTQLKEIDSAADIVIASIKTPLTPAQKQRIQKVSQAYKTLTLTPDGKTLAELAATPPPSEIDDKAIDSEAMNLTDSSMLKSRAASLDTQYVKTTMESDLARVLLTFNTKGMFVTKIKTTEHNDALNRYRQYSVGFEDARHQTHTVQFSLPLVDTDGTCLINGIPMRLTKQRINNPIVVSGPNRVSLNTNFNKTLVERVGDQARSFYPYLMRLLKGGKFNVVRGGNKTGEVYPKLNFPKDSLPDIAKSYKKQEVFFTIRVGEEYDALEAEFPLQYLQTPVGVVRVAEAEKLTNLTQHPLYKHLSADQKKFFAGFKKFLVLTLEPTTLHVRWPFEYSTLNTNIDSITKDKLKWHFQYGKRLVELDSEVQGQVLDLEREYGIYIGTSNGKDGNFLNMDGTLSIVDIEDGSRIRTSTIIDEVYRIGEVTSTPLAEHVELKILNKELPIGFVLCYRYGLSAMLEYLNTKYWMVDRNKREPEGVPKSAVRLRFADRTLIIPRTPNVPYLIFAGLAIYNLRDVYFEDMDEPDVYYSLIQQKKLSTNYLKGVDSFYELFIDPITAEILTHLKEPTNVRDLLIRATALLSSADHEPSSSSVNSRIRSYERFPSVLYNEMARAFANYTNRGVGARNTFSLPPNAVMMRLATDQLMSNVDVINPIHEIKQQTLISHVGDGGRSEDTFMIEDRRFTKDQLGVVSEATVDSGKVGINALTSVDPHYENIRGMSQGMTPDEAQPTNILSVTSLLFPGLVYDD